MEKRQPPLDPKKAENMQMMKLKNIPGITVLNTNLHYHITHVRTVLQSVKRGHFWT